VACTFGIDDDRGMGTVCYRGPIGVVEEIARVKIACMPAVDDQRRRSGTEIGNVLMQQIELIRDGIARELEHPAPEPVLCTA
jgi:hypothetical protein